MPGPRGKRGGSTLRAYFRCPRCPRRTQIPRPGEILLFSSWPPLLPSFSQRSRLFFDPKNIGPRCGASHSVQVLPAIRVSAVSVVVQSSRSDVWNEKPMEPAMECCKTGVDVLQEGTHYLSYSGMQLGGHSNKHGPSTEGPRGNPNTSKTKGKPG